MGGVIQVLFVGNLESLVSACSLSDAKRYRRYRRQRSSRRYRRSGDTGAPGGQKIQEVQEVQEIQELQQHHRNTRAPGAQPGAAFTSCSPCLYGCLVFPAIHRAVVTSPNWSPQSTDPFLSLSLSLVCRWLCPALLSA